jgi:fumarate hydratase class I
MPDFAYEDLLPGAGSNGTDETPWRLLTTDGVSVVDGPGDRQFLQVEPEALRLLTETAMHDIAHYLRPGHLQQLANILEDPDASNNDKFVALDLLKNANIAAGGILPMCQDTGTAIVVGKRGQHVLTDGDDERAISEGVFDAYTRLNLRYSQMAPVTMWEEKNTGNNLPAQIEMYSDTAKGHETAYKFLFMAKGGGSANKSYLYQETKAILNEKAMLTFLDEKLRSLGTAACPPYHLAIVIGGTSAEFALKTAKYASAKYLDALPATARPSRSRSRSRAAPTARCWARSRPGVSSSSSSRPSRLTSCPRRPMSTSTPRRLAPTRPGVAAMSWRSTCSSRCRRSSPS